MIEPFATLADIQQRHPRELAILAADEVTRAVDAARVEAALYDVSVEIRTILRGRYTPDEMARLDAESLGVLKLYAIDMALYRVALSFARSSEAIKERYDAAVKRLEAIAKGTGGLSIQPGGGGGSAGPEDPARINPNEVVIDAPERVFSRRRYGSDW